MTAATAAASKAAVAAAIAAVLLEFGLLRALRRAPYSLRNAGISVVMGLAYSRAVLLAGLLWGWLYFFCYTHRFFTVPLTGQGVWAGLALFVLVDFCYYWQHRFAHRTRLGWASHVQHHSVEEINMAAPFRLSVTSPLSGYQAFFAPIALLGFHPAAIGVMVIVNVALQTPVHTELVRTMWRPIEWVFNTPSHHRVHHASNALYLDRNFGGVFIVWDRLFGTFQAEVRDEPAVYGLVDPVTATSIPRFVLKLWFQEWSRLARDVWRARRWSHKVAHVFRPPARHAEPAAGAR